MERRDFLRLAAAPVLANATVRLAAQAPAERPDISLRISPVQIEIAPRRIIRTIGYNGSVPGPLLRCREGDSLAVDVRNDTGTPELVHWHGLHIPSDVDGADEEGTPMVPAHGSRRYTFVARPSGTRWYHTHGFAGRDLKQATYTGQYGFLYIEPRSDPARFDAEVFLAIHGWEPTLVPMGDPDGTLDVEYKYFSVNGHALGAGEPIRVQEGQRVMFRLLNASATSTHRLAFGGHTFTVVALDGNPVAQPSVVQTIELGPAERVDAVVLMNAPGVWILGDVDEGARRAGLGVVVEYANQQGPARWVSSHADVDSSWSYSRFGTDARPADDSVQAIRLVFKKKFAGRRWVDNWTVNGKSFPETDTIRVRRDRRYRLELVNDSDEAHPVHLHRHSFELVAVAGRATSGVMKDVVMVPPMGEVHAEFTADNPGPTLFHCHQQLHMDYGFMTLFDYER
jgi:FtsP/CotA-like multicopper oxidase with cupredoxin domain